MVDFKKILFGLICFFFLISCSSKKYDYSDIEGSWICEDFFIYDTSIPVPTMELNILFIKDSNTCKLPYLDNMRSNIVNYSFHYDKDKTFLIFQNSTNELFNDTFELHVSSNKMFKRIDLVSKRIYMGCVDTNL